MDPRNAQRPPSESDHRLERRAWVVGLGLAALSAGALVACNREQPSLFTRLAAAQRLAADLRVRFNKAADASNRAVMADTDETSLAFAAEAVEAKNAVQRDDEELVPLLEALAYSSELRLLGEFRGSFAAYQKLDKAILELAVENSNLKAQKLSYGPAREAAHAFRTELDAFAAATSLKKRCSVLPLVYAAVVAIREIQVIEAPHIAQSDDATMSRMELDMDALEASARLALRDLSQYSEGDGGTRLAAATAALDRFKNTHVAIIALSRKNTNVRSLAMSLGDKRGLTTSCDSSLTALQNELAKEGLKATR